MSVPLPDSFRYHRIGGINCAVAGDGPPVLLLHGYPQTHLIWHRVAPELARDHTVVLCDLRGYGDSHKPAGTAEYAKRVMAAEQVDVLRELGFDRFDVVGHDRGGRVAHRMALDHVDAVKSLTVLDIVPTRFTFLNADKDFGLGYYHWFFLAAGNGIPEHLIGADPEFWIRTRMRSRHGGGTQFDEAAIREYVRCFSDPAAISASCEDYRAAATIDLADDEADAGTPVSCPVLALWGEHSFVGRSYDVLDVWRQHARDVRGHSVSSDHYLPEEAPDDVVTALRGFLPTVSVGPPC